jgi:hypothetical protein
VLLPLHPHLPLSHVIRLGKGVMTFIERARLFESASWHFKSYQDQLFCSVLAVETVQHRDNRGFVLHSFIILCMEIVKGPTSDIEDRRN